MTEHKKRAIVICPGRGTYNKEELGYLSRFSVEPNLLQTVDEYRNSQNQPTVSELDAMNSYSMKIHTAGEHASALIYTCAMADFNSIDQDTYDIVAVTGNSMGWYIALAAAGALTPSAGIELVNTMGSMMSDGLIGGQIIYPIVNEDWTTNGELENQIKQWLVDINTQENCEVYISIFLGGYWVFAGNSQGLQKLEELLPNIQDRYPMKLYNHGAFHTPLMKGISANALHMLNANLFQQPNIPLIDGLGRIWQTYYNNAQELYNYTLSTQVTETYQFSNAINVAIKEFAPEVLIILGPGATLGGAVGQCLVSELWQFVTDKSAFIARQKQNPIVLSMGLPEQRALVVK